VDGERWAARLPRVTVVALSHSHVSNTQDPAGMDANLELGYCSRSGEGRKCAAAAVAMLAVVLALGGSGGRERTRRVMGGEADYMLMAAEEPDSGELDLGNCATVKAIRNAAGVIDASSLGAVLHTDPASAAWLPLDLFPPWYQVTAESKPICSNINSGSIYASNR